jgi:hypothetical protein
MAASSHDRDRNFEKALARHVRASSPAEASSASPSCGDIEALAAYHEGALPPDQRNSWKAHIQDCPRCQEILAHLQATDAIPLGIPQNLQKKKAAGVPVLKPRRSALWRWAAPAGAIAAGLLVWVTVRENKPIQIDELRKNASSVPDSSPAPQVPTPKPPVPVSKPESTNGKPGLRAKSAETVQPSETALGDVLQEKRQASRAATSSGAQPKPSMSAREQNTENSVSLYAGAPPQPDVADRTDATAKELKEKAPALLPSLAPPAPASKPMATPAPAPEPAPKIPAMSQTVAVESASTALQTENAATGSLTDKQKQDLPLSGRNYVQLLTLAKDATAVIIAAPHSSTQWRIGAAGIIARSKDAGAHWTLQSSGVITDLLAGSAASKKICWIVGRAGTILRTTDGGAHWSKVPPPVVDDFASVFAVSAKQATVSPAHGTYQTVDGGATWKKLAPE